MTRKQILQDLAHNWHPCSQMKDFENNPPLLIKSAQGAYITQTDGSQIIDAISSWWCKPLGHHYKPINDAITEQLNRFEHVMFGNTTYEHIIELSEKLSELLPNLNKISYASDGSCAVEIALKISLHSRQITGELKRQKFMALENSYHGETGLAMSVSDLGIYRRPYQSVLPDVTFIQAIPYVTSKHDPLWQDCGEHWRAIEAQLIPYQDELTAIIVEPIVQGAGGMKIYSQDFLARLRNWTREKGIHLIADEIMTGFYRTGLELACHYAACEPDFLCLAKGLTNGVLPLSVTLTNQSIYQLFYDDYEAGKTFFHSHTHSGNALAVVAALHCLKGMALESLSDKVVLLEPILANLMQEIADDTQALTNVRYLGGIVAADLINPNAIPRFGYQVGCEAMRQGALLRPIGNTVYWFPPLNIEENTLLKLRDITRSSILNVNKI
ncbi:MAG: adenosylmethionine--8-amino-7-oxononanoate transaminase [Legionellales bacterium]|nr:adenosylmethionine--8-amino-7-oxononanoate transaminase [Legionellales bacterium]